VCQHDVGAQYGFAGNIDVCLAVSGGGTVGSNVYCAVSGPCGAGEGDCDGRHECQAGLVCQHDVGAQYGFAGNIDVCEVSAEGGGPWAAMTTVPSVAHAEPGKAIVMETTNARPG
jgi:hypothetical protein